MKDTSRRFPAGKATALAVAAALLFAGVLALLSGAAREAEAAFPGKNGKIAFQVDGSTIEPRTIYTVGPNGGAKTR